MTSRAYLGVTLALLVLPACETQLPSHAPRDANVEDAPGEPRDARADFDAEMFDAGSVDRDAGSVDRDAGSADFDAATIADAGRDAGWGTCTYGGTMGTCMSMSDCTAGSMPVMGLCPGPADIQCCLPSSGTITPADVLARLGACSRIGGDYAKDVGGTANIPICQTSDVIWWTADLDVDCDGGRGATCRSDPDYLPDTSAVDSTGAPLDASTLPFIVIPLASTRFRYSEHGIRAGQIALVMYRDRMVFGIFGDAGPASIIGEASFAMAEALGIPSSPRSGGVDSGVTYLVFTGTTARVTHNEDHAEAVRLGEPLLASFVGP